jgi:hypothetical protein
MSKKPTEAVTEKLTKTDPIPQDKLGEYPSIARVDPENFVQEAQLEEFMNQVLTIRLHTPGGAMSKEDYEVAPLNVNGVPHPLIRGKSLEVKRKYVEVLARARISNYQQVCLRPDDLSSMDMIPTHHLRFDFQVLRDPHKYGDAWLNNILAQPA